MFICFFYVSDIMIIEKENKVMFKTLLEDRKIIEGKYHDPKKPYNAIERFAYHGYDFDKSTGLSEDKLREGLDKLDSSLTDTSHPIHKARLFEFVLDNTMIDVPSHDYFIGIYSWGRPIADHTLRKWKNEVYNSFDRESKILKNYADTGTFHGSLDFEHTVPDWDSILSLGFRGILMRAEEAFLKIENPTENQRDFFEAIKIEYNAILRLIDRLYRYALAQTHPKAKTVAESLKNLFDGAPKDTFDVLQIMYIYFMLSESIDNYQVRSLGYGLDTSLYPYYKADIESGRYTKEQIGEFIGYFLMQFQAIDNYWGQPIYLAGTNLDGSTRVNDLSYLILDVYDKLGLYNPKVQIKVSKNTPKEFIFKILEMIRHGTSSFVFLNEDMIIKCLMSGGATYEEALDSVISGCYEYKVKRKGIGISTQYVNALKFISYTIDGGADTLTGIQAGTKTHDITALDSFEKFYNAYLQQLSYCINEYTTAMEVMETRVQEINPCIVFSATIPECVKKMSDAMNGGLENYSRLLINGLGSAVDALMAVKELVYDKQLVTLTELKAALDADWVGYENLRATALSLIHKYGNGDKMSDSYADTITRKIRYLIANRKNGHGCGYILEMHSARTFITQGLRTKATPDGRKAGEETSKNASPTPGKDKNGVTALINSATTIDTGLCDGGFCLDVMLHPTAIEGEEGLSVFKALIDTYMKNGGQAIHFNIFSAEMLRDAQENPEKYQNLQVRVCGWNVLWNNMDKKEQDAYILRAENMLK